jgi:hypothetical protein
MRGVNNNAMSNHSRETNGYTIGFGQLCCDTLENFN